MADEMNLFVYNTSFKLVGIVDRYTSLIWTDRYDECGDFELTIPYESKWNSVFQLDYFCRTDYSDRWAVIEKIEETKEEDGPLTVIVSGRSLESILERRIVIGDVEFGSDDHEVNVQNSILSLIYANIIAPNNIKRRISADKLAVAANVLSLLVELSTSLQRRANALKRDVQTAHFIVVQPGFPFQIGNLRKVFLCLLPLAGVLFEFDCQRMQGIDGLRGVHHQSLRANQSNM